MSMLRSLWITAFLVLSLPQAASAAGLLVSGEVSGEHSMELVLSRPLPAEWDWQGLLSVTERENPDIPLTLTRVQASPDRRQLVLEVAESLSRSAAYAVSLTPGPGEAAETLPVQRGMLSVLLSIIIGAALIQNFVFSRYLGLCIFFGASGRKETAVGMGFSFCLVMALSAVFVWAVYNFVLKPLHLQFLQVITFVGIIAVFVQLLDTVLRKVNPFLFRKLGVYLVLITTNCIVLAVPLILVDNAYGLWESLALALGSGGGFALALFLMSCVRERLELADVPGPFKGLPIAFVVAGLFALAFLGFSGMSF